MVMEDLKENNENKTKQGSNFAVTVALQTLKERSQGLQNRLSKAEEENVSLRGIIARSSVNNDNGTASDSEIAALREQTAILAAQKAHLSQQLQMVTSENNQLWKRLSKSCDTTNSLGKHLSSISEVLKEYANKNNTTEGGVDEIATSLQEISLKLENSFLKEKTALEQQCAAMAEMQNIVDCDINLENLGIQSDEALVDHYQRLTKIRDMVRDHQNILKVGVEVLKSSPNKNEIEKKTEENSSKETKRTVAVQKSEEDDDSEISNLRNWGSPDWTCPMCGKYLPFTSVDFGTFHKHVIAHFAPDEEDDDDPTFTYNLCHS